MRNIFFAFLTLGLAFLAGCSSTQAPAGGELEDEAKLTVQNPYAPQPGDEALKRGLVYLDAVAWDDAGRVLTISGSLPNPCCQLRVDVARDGKDVSLDVYSLLSEDGVCAQMLEPFEAQLEFENFSGGESAISVNGELVD